MKASALLKIHAAAKAQVRVSCDEYHAHTTSCLSGPKDAVTICKLVEEVSRLRSIISEAAASLDANDEMRDGERKPSTNTTSNL